MRGVKIAAFRSEKQTNCDAPSSFTKRSRRSAGCCGSIVIASLQLTDPPPPSTRKRRPATAFKPRKRELMSRWSGKPRAGLAAVPPCSFSAPHDHVRNPHTSREDGSSRHSSIGAFGEATCGQECRWDQLLSHNSMRNQKRHDSCFDRSMSPNPTSVLESTDHQHPSFEEALMSTALAP